MVVIFVDCCVGVYGTFRTIPTVESYGAGDFIAVKLLNSLKPQHNNPTNMTNMVVPFAPHTAWDLWIRLIGRADPLPKGSGRGVVKANNLNH